MVSEILSRQVWYVSPWRYESSTYKTELWYFRYFHKDSHSTSISIWHACKLKQIIKCKFMFWMSRMYRYRKECISQINGCHLYIRSYDVEDIIDGFHFEVFIVDKLIKNFQIQYYSFTSIFFIPGENT